MKHEEPHKPAPRKRAPRKHIEVPVVIQPIIQAPVQQTIETPTVVTQPIPQETTPVLEAHKSTIEDRLHDIEEKIHYAEHEVEEKVNSTWGKVRSWKWLWLVIVGVCLILVYFGYQWVNKKAEKRAEAKIEIKKDSARQYEISADTSLLGWKAIQVMRVRRQDSILHIAEHMVDDLKKMTEYQKSLLPKDEIIQHEIDVIREKVNDPDNTDDDVRRNAESQMSKQQNIGRRPAANSSVNR